MMQIPTVHVAACLLIISLFSTSCQAWAVFLLGGASTLWGFGRWRVGWRNTIVSIETLRVPVMWGSRSHGRVNCIFACELIKFSTLNSLS